MEKNIIKTIKKQIGKTVNTAMSHYLLTRTGLQRVLKFCMDSQKYSTQQINQRTHPFPPAQMGGFSKIVQEF
jgi:hypothetical protein